MNAVAALPSSAPEFAHADSDTDVALALDRHGITALC
jgi:hypothetical protein